MSIDKARLARSFNRSADAYRRHSQLQQGISRRLLSMLRGHLSASTDVIPQAGHALPISHPQRLAERLLDCLARHDARAAMAAYTGSVSFIGGAHDRLVPAASLHASSRLLSRSRTFIVPQAGHALPISHPQRLAERLLDCLDHADVH